MVTNPSVIFVSLMVVFLCLAFSYLLNNYAVVTEVANAWQVLAWKYKQGKLQVLDNADILNVLRYKEYTLLLYGIITLIGISLA